MQTPRLAYPTKGHPTAKVGPLQTTCTPSNVHTRFTVFLGFFQAFAVLPWCSGLEDSKAWGETKWSKATRKGSANVIARGSWS